MEELMKIKETWVPADKKKEYIITIDSLEKNNKILKDDIIKKKGIYFSIKRYPRKK
jgi:hypothetical protein